MLAIGCGDRDPSTALTVHRVASVEEASALDGKSFEQILWRASVDQVLADLARIRQMLANRGRLVVVGQDSNQDRDRRSCIAALSNRGFVILRESTGWPSDWDASGGGTRWTIEARRDAFTVRAYVPGDEEAILGLFEPSFHAARSVEHWRWKYQNHPFGNLRLSMAWSPDGELAAHHGAYPARLWRHGDVLPAQQIGDLMTDPRFRRVGLGARSLLARCARHAYAVFGRGRVAFNYGFNTATSLEYSLRFMRAEKVEPVGFWTSEPGTFSGSEVGSYRVREDRSFDRGFDRFFARSAPAYGCLFERRSDYLNWRYRDRPDVDYLVLSACRWGRRVGWAVFRRQGEDLIWGDGLFVKRHAAGAARVLLAAAVASNAGQGASRITTWSSARPPWWAATLRELGFRSEGEPHGLWMTCVPHDLPDAAEQLRSTFYMMGDGDLF